LNVIPSRTDTVALAEIRPHPKNPRQGDVGAITDSINHHGFFGRLLIQESTGYIIAGNHRYQAALALGADTIPVEYLDVDDQQAAKILAVDNRLSDLADYDRSALTKLLLEFAEQDTLAGTGYTGDDLDELMLEMESALGDAYEEEQTAGGGDAAGYEFTPSIVYTVVFDTREQKDAFMSFLTWLRTDDANIAGDTIAERLLTFLQDHADPQAFH